MTLSVFYSADNTSAAKNTPPVSPAGQLHDQLLLTANGSSDTHALVLSDGRKNPHRSAGTPYKGIRWADIVARSEAPTCVPKNSAPFVIPSTHRGHDGRSHAAQRERGQFWLMTLDIDTGSLELQTVLQAVQAVVGDVEVLVYSSGSAAPGKLKWRVLVPLAAPIPGAERHDIQLAFFELMAAQGVVCDTTLARTGQVAYLPNVPPDRRDAAGRPVFYQRHHTAGPLLELTPTHPIVVARDALLSRREREAAQQAERAATYQAERLKRVEATGDDFEPIAHFNENHTVSEMLARYGFVRRDGGRGSHWKSPLSTSGSYSTEDKGDHWVTVSQWAHAHNVGRVTANGNRWGDAFELYAFFEHGGDRREAVRAYAELVRPRAAKEAQDTDDAIVVEPRPAPAGSEVTLEAWRADVAQRRAAAVRTPGLHLDRSPTGSGKTHATIASLRLVQSSLTVLPTHTNVQERVREMQAQGLEAVGYPEATADNCQNFEEYQQAQRVGLVAGVAVCPGCPFKDACQYRAEAKAADAAQHRVGTHERLRRSDKVAGSADVVVIDESPDGVVAPSLAFHVSKLNPVDRLAHSIQNHWHSEATLEQKSFAGAMQQVVSAIRDACGRITVAGSVDVELPALSYLVPAKWQRRLWQAIRQVGVGSELRSEALQLVTKAVVGDLTSLTIVTDLTEAGRVQHFVVGKWTTPLPAEASTILLDATGDADDIAAAAGLEVHDCTPEGHLPYVHPVVQVDDDVSRGVSSNVVGGLIEAFLERHPELQRVGVIGHSVHITDLFDGEQLGAAARARVTKWCYFGQGPDRASNDWHQECDHLLIVGTPRANPGDLRRWLVQHGLEESASRDGCWGPRHWQSVTVDGTPVVVAGMGYQDPEWHRAYLAVSRATLEQAVGRGRSILPEGIPVTVLTSEPTPFPQAPKLSVRPTALRATVDAVHQLGQCAKSPIENSYKGNCTSGVPTGDIVLAIGKADGIGRRAVMTRLKACLDAGLLVQPRRGWWALPGTDTPVPEPAPQAVRKPAVAVVPRVTHATVVVAEPPRGADPVQVVAAAALEPATTSACTSAPPPPPDTLERLAEDFEERAAILEFDAGHTRELAERLAHEMVYGRDHTPLPPDDTTTEVQAGADHIGLGLRGHPFVQQVLKHFPGRVTVLRPEDDPFHGRRQQAQPRPGACQCGHDRPVRVPIHGGKSVRLDCGHCDRFLRFEVWHGRRVPVPWETPPQPLPVPLEAVQPDVSLVPAVA